MKRSRIARVLLVVAIGLASVVVLAAGAALFIQVRGIPRYAVVPVSFTAELTPERVARGRTLVESLCAQCHADPSTHALTGKRMLDAPPEFGVLYARNITQHKELGIGRWTDSQLAYLLRTGIRPDGQYLPPYMAKLPHVSDEDLKSIIAFLRSDDPKVRAAAIPDRDCQPSFLVKLLSHLVWKPLPYPEKPIQAPPLDNAVAHGRYLVSALECFTCHSADFKTMNVLEPEASEGYLGGGNLLLDVNGDSIHSANITFDEETGIGRWSAQDFRRAVRHGFRPNGTPIRYPMQVFRSLSDAEVNAIFSYLATVPKIKNPRTTSVARPPEGVSRGQRLYGEYGCRSCHGEDGIGNCDLTHVNTKHPDDAALRRFIDEPVALVPDSKMPSWKGVIAEDDYADLIAWVRQLGRAAEQRRTAELL